MGTMLFLHWWAVALRGVIAILFGLVALFWPRLTLEMLVICFGAFALVGGVFVIVVALGDRGAHERWGVLLVEGLAGVVVGLLTFFWPFITALVLLYLIAIWAIVTGGSKSLSPPGCTGRWETNGCCSLGASPRCSSGCSWRRCPVLVSWRSPG